MANKAIGYPLRPFSLQLPDTLLWMEEIRSEYILGASADAHMEATSSMSPKLKMPMRRVYILNESLPSIAMCLVTVD
jgi:hypothetical protein